jgi:outer membrane protein TolC
MNIVNVERPGRAMEIQIPGMGGLPFPQHIGLASVNFAQPIYTFGQIGNAVDAARNAVKMAESGHELARREIIAAAAQIYWTAKMTDDMVIVAQKNLKASTDARRQLERAGRANRSNLIKIEADIAAKEIAVSDAEFNRDSAHRMLKVLAGIDSGVKLNLTDDFPKSFTELAAAPELKSNPEWDILENQAALHDHSARSRRAARLPTLAATASYNWVAMHDDMYFFHGNKSQSANWGLAMAMPLFDGGLSRANATMDAMSAESARQDLDKSKKLKSNEYIDATMRYDHLRGNLEKLFEARNLADRAAKISADRFASGQTSAIELSEVQAALFQMDLAVLNAKFNILMAAEQVRKLTGN